jgi:hypothetical protein
VRRVKEGLANKTEGYCVGRPGGGGGMATHQRYVNVQMQQLLEKKKIVNVQCGAKCCRGRIAIEKLDKR